MMRTSYIFNETMMNEA